ncbi:MAG: sugar phosphate isomerase/epimerase [Fimbriimonadaceae bacterium]
MGTAFFKALWGMEDLPLPERLKRVAEAGYCGFEAGGLDADRLGGLPRDLGLRVIGQAYAVEIDDLRAQIEACAACGAESVTVHAGKDWWSYDRGLEFLGRAIELGRELDVRLCFETHRGRLLYEPQSTARYLRDLPGLNLCADFSHWTCVCESMLEDQEEALAAAVPRVAHLHARVGFEEGPQVPDFRLSRWQRQTNRFLEIWDRIRESAIASGRGELTVTPEYGPPDYQWTDVATDRPVNDLFEVCLAMKDLLAERWR